MDKLPVKMGIELTYISEYKYKRFNLANRIRNKMLDIDLDYNAIHEDGEPSSVEISTPPFEKLSEVRDWYNRFKPIMRKYKLRATYDMVRKKRKGIWIESGGGHIHTEIPEMSKEERSCYVLNMLRYVTNNPWLTWVFDEFCTTSNSMSFLTEFPKEQEMFEALFYHSTELTYDRMSEIVDRMKYISTYQIKRNAVAYRGKTIELRFFNSPRDFEQLEDHIKIAGAIVNYNLEAAKKFRLRNVHYSSMYNWIERVLDLDVGIEDISINRMLIKKVEEIFKMYLHTEQLTLNKPISFYMRNLRRRLKEGVMLI